MHNIRTHLNLLQLLVPLLLPLACLEMTLKTRMKDDDVMQHNKAHREDEGIVQGPCW